MTDTGQVPGEGLPENAGTVEQQGVAAPSAYTYLSETAAEDEDLLLPGARGAWGNEVAPPAPEPVVETVHEPGPHEISGRDSGSVDLGAVRPSDPVPSPAPAHAAPHLPRSPHEQTAPPASRRPLHLGPPVPSTSATPVRSLADRGPADVPVRPSGPPTLGPEYLDVPQTREATAPQPAQPWGGRAVPATQVVPAATPAETVVPEQGRVSPAQAVVARVTTEAVEYSRQAENTAAGAPAAPTPTPTETPTETTAPLAEAGQADEAAGHVPAAGDVGAPGIEPEIESSPHADQPRGAQRPDPMPSQATLDPAAQAPASEPAAAEARAAAPATPRHAAAEHLPDVAGPVEDPAPDVVEAPETAPTTATETTDAPQDAAPEAGSRQTTEQAANDTAPDAATPGTGTPAPGTTGDASDGVPHVTEAQSTTAPDAEGQETTATAPGTPDAPAAASSGTPGAPATTEAGPTTAVTAEAPETTAVTAEAPETTVAAPEAPEATVAGDSDGAAVATGAVAPAASGDLEATVAAPGTAEAPAAAGTSGAPDAAAETRAATSAAPENRQATATAPDVPVAAPGDPGSAGPAAPGTQGAPAPAAEAEAGTPEAQAPMTGPAGTEALPAIEALPAAEVGADTVPPSGASATEATTTTPVAADATDQAAAARTEGADPEDVAAAELAPAADAAPAAVAAGDVPAADADAGAPAPAEETSAPAPDTAEQAGATPDTAEQAGATPDAAEPAAVTPTTEPTPGMDQVPSPDVPTPGLAQTPEATEPVGAADRAPGPVPATPTEPAHAEERGAPAHHQPAQPVQGPQQTHAPAGTEQPGPPGQDPWPSAPSPRAGAAPGVPATATPAAGIPVGATPTTSDRPPAPLPGAVPLEPQSDQPLGQFVPVEGSVPTTPHLAPTPPQPLTLPAQEQTAPDAVAPDPAAGDSDAVPAAPGADADPDPAQNADDLATGGAAAEDQPAQQTPPTPPAQQQSAAVADAGGRSGPAAPAYDDAEREAVLKVMRERRDIRNGFRSDPIPHEVLLRVLEAAHTAPSVGHSQPWDFVVIRSADTRRSMHELAMRQREAYAKSLPKGRAKQFKELKIEAILDTPVNIVVTADPTRGGRHTLGRHTQPQMAPYSSALAVENLWLAARAEGLGVGWVSFFDEREMVRALGLPEHLEVVAYLCVGYVDEFPDEPELMQAGWSKRRPLSWVVHEETYGRRALPGEDPHDLLAETVSQIRPLDAKALGEAWERQKRMTKPAGALGMLEIISAQLSGLSRQCPPPIPEPAAVAVFAGDHGVHAQGVTPWPQEVTAQMVANFLGGGAVCNAFATQVGAEVCVVDVGVASDLPATPGLLPRKVRAGTSDMTAGPAMTREEAKKAIEVGIETARDLVAAGNKALLTGEMGIANTTASAALISVFTGADPAEVTGRGTGINDETLVRKTDVVRRALELHQPDPADPIGVLAAVGGFEHAAMVGLLLGGASLRTPVILDGVSAGAAALVARAIAPEVLAACIAGHRSAEPGHVAALNKLGLRPLVDLDLRLGEGTGALLALPLVQSTARAMHEVATFDSAGVTEK
ncbi:nicotinate-nucleotide--dimethylbenzimidazole phosphoribosyltransferase [Streptomyces sp. NPDC005931]|uniref:nicotinate-nucleotide--dimethylbenzimidazole phosphoribosyltransferase n=1 Tax=Streptomyces sp. NPDC005931 TaxID=3364737 RepID=UPI0036A61431